MKSYIDFFETYKGELLGTKKFRNKFIRLWGTETVNGVQVMKSRFTIYPGYLNKNADGTYTDEAKKIQSFCKMLGSWSQIKESNFKAIAGYYFYLNPNKDDTSELAKELLAEKVDLFCPKDVWQECTINYIDQSNPTRFDGWTKEQILMYIDNDYANIFSTGNGFIIEDDIDKLAIGQYVLFDDGTEFAVEVVSSSRTSLQNTQGLQFTLGRSSNIYYTGLNVVIRYKRIVDDINPDGLLITAMINETNGANKSKVQELQRSSFNNNDEIISSTDLLDNELWYNGQLRYSAVIASGVKTKVAVETVLSVLDSGTIKKKVKWYKKILGFVLIIIAIALTLIPGTQAAAGGLWTALAIYMGTAVLIMTLIQAQWAKSNGAAAEYMGRWIKIANIVSMVAGLAALYTALAKQALAQALTTELIKQGATQASAQSAVAAMTEVAVASTSASLGVTATASSFVTAAGNMIMNSFKSIGMKVAGKTIEMRRAAMEADLKNTTAQYEESQEALADTLDKNMNIGVEDIKLCADLSKQANARYDFNSPYEAESATVHIGNICKASFYNGARMNLRAEDLLQIK